jgi:hypothetical protein
LIKVFYVCYVMGMKKPSVFFIFMQVFMLPFNSKVDYKNYYKN